jgi:hypothetical protein
MIELLVQEELNVVQGADCPAHKYRDDGQFLLGYGSI